MNEYEVFGELIDFITKAPINTAKWVIILIILVVSHIPAIKIGSKVDYAISRERKADKPKALGQVVTGTLIKEWESSRDDRNSYMTHARYQYTLNGETRIYKALFNNCGAPKYLTLYYDTPRKVFAVDDYHWENHKGCVSLFFTFLPWLIAVLFMLILKVDLYQ